MKDLRWLWITGIVVGAMLTAGPLWGAAATALSMTAAFDTLNQSGVADPRALATHVGHSLTAMAAGVVACPVGLGILSLSIIFLVRHRSAQPPLPATNAAN